MLALAHHPVPQQQSDRECPQLMVRTPSGSSTARSRTDTSYRERERATQHIQSHSRPNVSRSRTPETRLETRSPTLQPHDQPIPDSSGRPQVEDSMSSVTEQEKKSLDIHNYPASDLLKLLASLLQQIASSNDRLRPHAPQLSYDASASPSPTSTQSREMHLLTSASQEALSTPTSSLTFHARNIPSISLESYLLRILKYCPTTNEVFLSLLVYFDRMSKLSSETTGKDFIIDSYNIHRLVIAGVTVASKFFSDIFYTNSRYAKVGGLPQPELNQLELQFLLLNDFNLTITSSEMQRYAVQLIAYSGEMALPSILPGTGVRHIRDDPVNQNPPRQDPSSENYQEGDDPYDTEDETIRPSHSSGASETSSLATAQSDVDDDGEEEEEGYDDSGMSGANPERVSTP